MFSRFNHYIQFHDECGIFDKDILILVLFLCFVVAMTYSALSTPQLSDAQASLIESQIADIATAKAGQTSQFSGATWYASADGDSYKLMSIKPEEGINDASVAGISAHHATVQITIDDAKNITTEKWVSITPDYEQDLLIIPCMVHA